MPGISQIHGAGSGALHRCAHCGGDRGAHESGGTPAGAAPGAVQRKCQCEQGKDDKLMQAREAPAAVPHVPAGFTAQLAGLRGAGTPLSHAQRSFFEPRFGHDFGAVRLHTGALAERSADAVRARAFTLGNDVVFGRGEYAPDSPSGRHLLAHELTHVVQQTPLLVRRQPITPGTGDQTSLPGRMDPRQVLHGSTLPYREATELAKCIRIMGEANAKYCREKILSDEPIPHIDTAEAQKEPSTEKSVVTQPQTVKVPAREVNDAKESDAKESLETQKGLPSGKESGVEKSLSVVAETAGTDFAGKLKFEGVFTVTKAIKLGNHLFFFKEFSIESTGGLSYKKPLTPFDLQVAFKMLSLEAEKVKKKFGVLNFGLSSSLQTSGEYGPKSGQLGNKVTGGIGLASEVEVKYQHTEKSPFYIKVTASADKTYDKEGTMFIKWSPAKWTPMKGTISLEFGWNF